jgi:energy-coupling factor transporter transmembrane protein EcfT
MRKKTLAQKLFPHACCLAIGLFLFTIIFMVKYKTGDVWSFIGFAGPMVAGKLFAIWLMIKNDNQIEDTKSHKHEN